MHYIIGTVIAMIIAYFTETNYFLHALPIFFTLWIGNWLEAGSSNLRRWYHFHVRMPIKKWLSRK